LANTGREIDISRTGTIIYHSANGDKSWFVLISGKLKASLSQVLQEEQQNQEIFPGTVFGGYNPGEDVDHFCVEVTEPSNYIELSWDALERQGIDDEHSVQKLLSILGGKPYQIFKSTVLG